jgi:hypothetical protein
VILFGRHRHPVASTIRTVMGIRGEPSTPDDPARGQVWTAIIKQIDQPGSQSAFVSVADSPRENFHKHPWSIGGGGAAELKELLDTFETSLQTVAEEIGIFGMTNSDEVLVAPGNVFARRKVEPRTCRRLVLGDEVRDWEITEGASSIFPYAGETLIPIDSVPNTHKWMWPYRTVMGTRATFAKRTYFDEGRPWWEWHQTTLHRLRTPLTIIMAFVATHNHLVLDRGGKVFNRSSPIIKLPGVATEDEHLALLGLLNSSTACFWMKQVFFPKGGDHVGQEGARVRRTWWDEQYEFGGTGLGPLPLCEQRPLALSRRLDASAQERAEQEPGCVLQHWKKQGSNCRDLFHQLEAARKRLISCRGQMLRLQEELDWQCYRFYGLTGDDLIDPDWQTRELPIQLGERAFEIVLARKMRDEGLHTAWFERHGSTPITDLPAHWPADYRELVERRITAIESNLQIVLIEQPEYKRRWSDTPWEDKVTAALHAWLLDRLESYFDLDGRMNDAGKPTAHVEVSLLSTAKLADLAGRDPAFQTVAELYRGRPDFDVVKLVTELVEAESVPLLPVLRYKPSGLDKRRAWERTWELQRQEDAIDRRATKTGLGVNDAGWSPTTDDGKSSLNQAQADLLKKEKIGPISPPPKYKSADFQKGDYWRLRGSLDVPKERWVSFPHCEGADGLPLMAWAGYDHLQLAKVVAAHYVHVQEQEGGRDDPRLVPLLACLIELLPWLKQWHNEIDPEFNMGMGDYFEGFVQDEARQMNRTLDEVRAWQPPARAGRGRRRKATEPQG